MRGKINFLVPENQIWIIQNFQNRLPDKVGRKIQINTYEKLDELRKIDAGTVIFTGLGVITEAQRELSTNVWNQLGESESGFRLLNHPEKTLGRHELLGELHIRGINDFRSFTIQYVKETDINFPVFIRERKKHTGSLTTLIHSISEFDLALKDVKKRGYNLTELLVVEYVHTADSNNIYRKYSAFKIGDKIIARYLTLSYDWVTKENADDHTDKVLYTDELIQEEHEYIVGNPHEEELRNIFNIAHIDFGRIDYGFKDGRIQVWEINTLPTFGSMPNKADLRSDKLLHRKKKREPSKDFFYNQLAKAVEILAANNHPLEVALTYNPELVKVLKSERVKKKLTEGLLWAGSMLPKIEFIQKVRTYIKRKMIYSGKV